MNQLDHILIVDDDQQIRELTADYLRKKQLKVTVAADGNEMASRLHDEEIDLVVLDLMLPGEDGLSLCRKMQSETQNPIPVIMLTACTEDVDRIIGLETGADDYMTKPFVPRELLARIKAILRRCRQTPDGTRSQPSWRYIEFGDWRLDTIERCLVDRSGEIHALASAEFNLLMFFIEHPHRVISRDQLMNYLRGRDSTFYDRSVDLRVSRLRKSLGDDAKEPIYIKTIRNEGYVFSKEIRRQS